MKKGKYTVPVIIAAVVLVLCIGTAAVAAMSDSNPKITSQEAEKIIVLQKRLEDVICEMDDIDEAIVSIGHTKDGDTSAAVMIIVANDKKPSDKQIEAVREYLIATVRELVFVEDLSADNIAIMTPNGDVFIGDGVQAADFADNSGVVGGSYTLQSAPDFAGMIAAAEAENVLAQIEYIDFVHVERHANNQVAVYLTLKGTDALTADQAGDIKKITAQAFNIDTEAPVIYDMDENADVFYESVWVNEKIEHRAAQSEHEQWLAELEEIAYLDIDEASPEMKEQILEARRIIINNTEWVPDDGEGWVENVKTGEIIRHIPKFSEVFPDWDMPEPETTEPVYDDIYVYDAGTGTTTEMHDVTLKDIVDE